MAESSSAPAKIDSFGYVGVAKIGLSKIGATEIDTIKLGVSEIYTAKIRPAQNGLFEASSKKADSAKIGTA